METNRPAHRFVPVLVAIAVPGWLLAIWWAAEQGRAGETIFGEFAPFVETVISVGGASFDAAGAAMARLRLPVACVGLGALAWLAWRPTSRRGALPLAVALALGWAGQSFLLGGATLVGAGFFACAACAVAMAARDATPSTPLAPAVETAAVLALLALFAVLTLYRVEVDPDLYVDEMAYLRAARMFAGQVDVGRIIGQGEYRVYVYDQFQAQTIPLALHAAAISLLPSDAIATRLVSVLSVAVAMLVAFLVMRRALGAPTALWMLALGVSAPLVVVYSRAGHYISISLLHSVLSFAALLWLWRRWDLPAALVTGVLLGTSLYQYQLSWFVPVFALAAFCMSPTLWRRTGVVRVGAAVAVAAVAVALPGWIWFDVGLAAVNAQTFDRAAWNEPDADAPPSPLETMTGVVAVAPTPLSAAEQNAIGARVVERGLGFRNERTTQGESTVWILGRRPEVEALAAELRGEGWDILDYDWLTNDPWLRLRDMLKQLFAERSFESSGRWIDAPLLNPLLAPLLVIGLVMAWRRREEPVMRLLLVWVVGGALLPAMAGGPAPRRTTLMLPFAYALAALPLVALGAAAAQRGRVSKGLGVLLALAFFTAATLSGTYLYFREWHHHAGRVGGGGELLDVVKVLKTRPLDDVVLLPPLFPGLDNYLDAGAASAPLAKYEVERVGIMPPMAVLTRSCRRSPPFTWLFRDVRGQRSSIAVLKQHFEVEEELREGVRIVHVTAVRDDICERGVGTLERPPPRD